MVSNQEKIAYIKAQIREIPEFPRPGVLFRDIATLIKNPKAIQYIAEILANYIENKKIDYIVGIESRGFIFASLLSFQMHKGLVMLRKANKLPGPVYVEAYDLEYGQDVLTMQIDAIEPDSKVLIVDDLLATGGTVKTAIKLLEKGRAQVVGCCFVMELLDLVGREKLQGREVYSLISY